MANTLPKIKTADMRAYQRNYRLARKALGICTNCTKPLSEARRALGRDRCYECQAQSYSFAKRPRGKRKSTVV